MSRRAPRLIELDAEGAEVGVHHGPRAIAGAAEWITGGGILVHPTSTVYGLGGRAREDVDREVARMKGRAEPRPLIRVGAGVAEIGDEHPSIRWNVAARRLADAFWPGPLTLVIDDGTEAGIAIRVDSHPDLRAVLKRAGGTISSTSLNLSGEEPVRSGARALEWVGQVGSGSVPVAVLDGGELSGGPPSTIVSVRAGISVLRSGAIPPGDLQRAIEEIGAWDRDPGTA